MWTTFSFHRDGRAQRGTALVFSMVILTALTLLGVTAATTGTLGLRMASNAEENMNAFQTAQAAIDNIISVPGVLPTTGPMNVDSAPLPFTDTTTALKTTGGETITVTAARTIDCGTPPRIGKASSAPNFNTLGYRLSSNVVRTATARGQSSLREGFLQLIPKCH